MTGVFAVCLFALFLVAAATSTRPEPGVPYSVSYQFNKFIVEEGNKGLATAIYNVRISLTSKRFLSRSIYPIPTSLNRYEPHILMYVLVFSFCLRIWSLLPSAPSSIDSIDPLWKVRSPFLRILLLYALPRTSFFIIL